MAICANIDSTNAEYPLAQRHPGATADTDSDGTTAYFPSAVLVSSSGLRQLGVWRSALVLSQTN